MTISVDGKLLAIVCKNAAVKAFLTSSFLIARRSLPPTMPAPENHLPAGSLPPDDADEALRLAARFKPPPAPALDVDAADLRRRPEDASSPPSSAYTLHERSIHPSHKLKCRYGEFPMAVTPRYVNVYRVSCKRTICVGMAGKEVYGIVVLEWICWRKA